MFVEIRLDQEGALSNTGTASAGACGNSRLREKGGVTVRHTPERAGSPPGMPIARIASDKPDTAHFRK